MDLTRVAVVLLRPCDGRQRQDDSKLNRFHRPSMTDILRTSMPESAVKYTFQDELQTEICCDTPARIH